MRLTKRKSIYKYKIINHKYTYKTFVKKNFYIAEKQKGSKMVTKYYFNNKIHVLSKFNDDH